MSNQPLPQIRSKKMLHDQSTPRSPAQELNNIYQTIELKALMQTSHRRFKSDIPAQSQFVSTTKDSVYDRSSQYSHRQMEEILKPVVQPSIQPVNRFETENRKQFKSFDAARKSQLKDAQSKADVTLTRRMLEIYNQETIKKAGEHNILSNGNQLREKIKKYIEKRGAFGDQPPQNDYEWTPCRFSTIGWKYQQAGTQNRYLNHPNKRNVQGFQSSEKVKAVRSSPQNSLTASQNGTTIDLKLKGNSSNQSQDAYDEGNHFTTNYQQQYPDKGHKYKSINTSLTSKTIRQMELTKEYQDPPLPNIQAARIAYLQKKYDDSKILKLHNGSTHDTSIDAGSSIDASPTLKQRPAFKNQTLNGLLTKEDESELDQYAFWGGTKMNINGNFGKKKDRVTDWQSVYYQGGLFQHIK